MAVHTIRIVTLLQATIDGNGLAAATADPEAVAECVSKGWMLADDAGPTLTMAGADILRPHQDGLAYGEALTHARNERFLSGQDEDDRTG